MPPEDERSNYRLVRESLLDRLARPPRAVHRVRGELGAKAAAAAYEEELSGITLDVALLGIGADGHTASLFPHSPELSVGGLAAAVSRPDVERVTLTVRTLNAADEVIFLVVGAEKAEAAARAFGQKADPATPASMIRGRGRTTAFLDHAAGVTLPR